MSVGSATVLKNIIYYQCVPVAICQFACLSFKSLSLSLTKYLATEASPQTPYAVPCHSGITSNKPLARTGSNWLIDVKKSQETKRDTIELFCGSTKGLILK